MRGFLSVVPVQTVAGFESRWHKLFVATVAHDIKISVPVVNIKHLPSPPIAVHSILR